MHLIYHLFYPLLFLATWIFTRGDVASKIGVPIPTGKGLVGSNLGNNGNNTKGYIK